LLLTDGWSPGALTYGRAPHKTTVDPGSPNVYYGRLKKSYEEFKFVGERKSERKL